MNEYERLLNKYKAQGLNDSEAANAAILELQTPSNTLQSQMQGDLSNMPVGLAEEIGGDASFKDEQQAYRDLISTSLRRGKGITTPGKYGVYVANPGGAFASGFGSSYGTLSSLQNAQEAGKTYRDYSAWKASCHNDPNSEECLAWKDEYNKR